MARERKPFSVTRYLKGRLALDAACMAVGVIALIVRR
jgi:hypothetical protein